jgi:hypothetical protein
MICLGSFHRNPAKDTGSMHIYPARVGIARASHQEKYEHIETIRIPLEELVSQVERNEIRDINTIFAVLMLKSQLDRGKIQP